MIIIKFEEVKREIIKLQKYVDIVEAYEPDSFRSHCIKYYAILGNVNEVAKVLNEEGNRMQNRKVTSSDVSAILKSFPEDELHSLVKKSFEKNKKKNPNL